MPKKLQLTVYSLEHCPHCEILKDFLKKKGQKYLERDLSTAEALTDLRVNGVFVSEAPVLQNNDDFYTTTELFPAGKLDEKRLDQLLAGA